MTVTCHMHVGLLLQLLLPLLLCFSLMLLIEILLILFLRAVWGLGTRVGGSWDRCFVSADPQPGMLRPARGPEDRGVNYGQGPGAVGRPDDQQQRGMYNPGDKNVLGSFEVARLGSESSSVAGGGLGCNCHSDDG